MKYQSLESQIFIENFTGFHIMDDKSQQLSLLTVQEFEFYPLTLLTCVQSNYIHFVELMNLLLMLAPFITRLLLKTIFIISLKSINKKISF